MKLFLSFLLAFLITAIPSLPAIAQIITGVVLDSETKEPLHGASVHQKNTPYGTITNAMGAFELNLNPEAKPIIEIRFLGYQAQHIPIHKKDTSIPDVLLQPLTLVGEGLLFSAFRLDKDNPITFTSLSREKIAERNIGHDIPVLLEMSPSVTSSSDAGAGIGYTHLRIRGVDPQRINVTVNGIPLNDSESHGVFWVNMPDFASSLDHIQIQRGVGTSSHGPAAFGATVNLETGSSQTEPYGEIHLGAGSFRTFQRNVQAGTGLMDNGWSFDGRLSYISSDGYIERASSDLWSFFLSGSRQTERSFLKCNIFSGREVTYQAWYGVHEEMLKENRRFNPAGRFTDTDGKIQFYNNQTDNYTQTHYQLHYTRRFSKRLFGNVSLHYTRGAGYYEEFRENDALPAYGFDTITIGNQDITNTNLIRQRWLDNHFGGFTFSTEYQPHDRWKWILGGGYNIYDGDHFGKIIWAGKAHPGLPDQRYYDNNGFKHDRNLYTRIFVDLSSRISLFGDIQLRTIDYSLDGIYRDQRLLDEDYHFLFINPKTGISYDWASLGQIYAYFGVSGKEPVRRDFTDATENITPKKETLHNFEAGYRGGWDDFALGVNLYYMNYHNQLINTGDINDVGAPVRTNVPESYRAGIEGEAAIRFSDFLQWNSNITLSRNRIPEFIERIDQYDKNWVFEGQKEIIHQNTAIAFSPSIIASSTLSGTYKMIQADWYAQYVGKQYLDNTSNPGRRLNPWWVNDLSLTFTPRPFNYFKKTRFKFVIHNILDVKYESNGYTFGYFVSESEIRENYFFPQAGRYFTGRISLFF